LRLSDLIKSVGGGAGSAPRIYGWREVEIRGLAADSRSVEKDFLFAALPGSALDGRDFISDALERGATAVLAPHGTTLGPALGHVTLVTDANPRRFLAKLAAEFSAPQPTHIAAVTGTSGKTSVVTFLRQIWEALGLKAASLGTLGLQPPRDDAPGSLTTPDPVALHRCLAALARDGFDHVALEASSHGLDQYRLDGVKVMAAAFTNLSRDHLDYHGSHASYLTAKSRLFKEVLQPEGTAVLNADAPQLSVLRALCSAHGHRVITYGRAQDATLRLDGVELLPEAQVIDFTYDGSRQRKKLSLVGAFQAHNVLAALGLALVLGADAAPAFDALEGLKGAPGRLERVANHPNGAPVFVDYSHKPGALQAVLEAVRPHASGRVAVVFGCGGDRDAGKRPIMGRIAAKLADTVIVTDDNPRSEDPAAIRAAIMAEAKGAREIGDRRRAIETAVAELGPDDLLVIAGKGHERGQIVGDRVLPFDDAFVARDAVAKVRAAAEHQS
jgi:UDP-N-acetylmuramoyl-L-alanyl-D-glutamate--2,6-diaminopimelate ligase